MNTYRQITSYLYTNACILASDISVVDELQMVVVVVGVVVVVVVIAVLDIDGSVGSTCLLMNGWFM